MDIDFYLIDNGYVDFLKKYEKNVRGFTCVPNIHYNSREKFFYGAVMTSNNIDIVNIALHISLKNFEQQCNGINIHFATLRGYLFHCGRRFALLIRVISAALLCRRHSANGRTYPAVIPIAHVVAPDHCFQLFYRVIRTSSATTVKQLVLHSRPHTFAAGVVMTSASCAVHALIYSILVQRGSV